MNLSAWKLFYTAFKDFSLHFMRKTRSRKIHDQELYPFLSIFINFINIYPFLSILSFLSIFIHFCPYLSILSISIVAPRVAPVQIYWIYKLNQLYLVFNTFFKKCWFIITIIKAIPRTARAMLVVKNYREVLTKHNKRAIIYIDV